MIVFTAYSILFLAFIFHNGFFGLLKDERIANKQLGFLFAGKILAVPVFYLVYQQLYGGLDKFDSGKFYHDVKVITGFAKTDPIFYLRLLFGFQDDTPGSYDYENCLRHTLNWDNGTVKDYLYNDNRVVIRIHTLFDWFTFNSYLVHALFSCFLSFTGIFFIYKSFKEYFEGKEISVLLVLCFLPALWFYTGGLLKEGIGVFVMGCGMYNVKQIAGKQFQFKNVVWFTVLLYLSFLLKPYLLLFSIVCFGLFFILQARSSGARQIIIYFTSISIIFLAVNALSLIYKKRTLFSAAAEHQRRFEAVSKGGIFLTDSTNYMQLKPDTAQIKRTGEAGMYQIRKGVSYMYWLPDFPGDTLYCNYNTDTLSKFRLIYLIPKSGSNIRLNKTSRLALFSSALYYSLLHPLFFNAASALQMLASAENLCLVISFLIAVFGLARSPKKKFPVIVFLFFSVSMCLLIGLSAPNSGAIFRYRAPAIIFIMLSAIYYLNFFKKHSTANSN